MNRERRKYLMDIKKLLLDSLVMLNRVRASEQDAIDNYPESLRSYQRYTDMEDALDTLEDAIDNVEEAISDLDKLA